MKVLLKRDNFQDEIKVVMKDLKEDHDGCDVTLVCDDGQIKAHKLVLAWWSKFLKNVLKKKEKQCHMYLPGVKLKDMVHVLNLMYMHQVMVDEEDLKSFFGLAENLGLKGFCPDQATKTAQPPIPAPPPNPIDELLVEMSHLR